MNNKEIRRVAERTNMTLEQAKRFRKSERKEAQKAIAKMMKTKARDEAKSYCEEAERRAANAAICTEVIAMRKKEIKNFKKQVKETTKTSKKIEKMMNKKEAWIEKMDSKMAAMTKKMNVKATTC